MSSPTNSPDDKADPAASASPVSKNTKTAITINGNDRSMDLNEHDVVCEKGRGDHERWPGNKLYRHLINVNKETYNDLPPIERSNIIGKIINSIQEKDGWFVHHNEATGSWSKLTEEKVRKKVSDDLRREVRRRREKRSHNSLFSAKLRAIKEMEEQEAAARDILEQVDDPRQTDVLFGPGARRHPGNKTYWHLMKLNLDQYIISPYGARSVISRNIVQGVRHQHGRFLEQDPKTGIWYAISDKRAIEKTSHALSNMKYKTRKRHPDEGPHYHQHHPGHISYRVGGPFEDFGYDDESEEDKILETDSPNTIFAKKRTKKFRLLRRMDDEDEEDTLDSKGSLKMASNGDGKDKHDDVEPTTPPVPGITKFGSGGKLITPTDSAESREDFQEYQEQRNPNSFRRVNPAAAAGMPMEADYVAYRGMNGGEVTPRLSSHYESYMKNYAAGAAHKSLSYASMRDEYPSMRRYGPDYGVPRGSSSGNGQMLFSSLPSTPYGGGIDARRRVLKSSAGPGGYWSNNDWPEYY
mmetsp:Transcript_17794/g.31112  ORF Transcript_17794/g.31112 Transcript_17794/m.31112 type:complete len:524 (+) Transcript_17794:105-1676(+)